MKHLHNQLTKLGLLAVCALALGLVSCSPNQTEPGDLENSEPIESEDQSPAESIGASNKPKPGEGEPPPSKDNKTRFAMRRPWVKSPENNRPPFKLFSGMWRSSVFRGKRSP